MYKHEYNACKTAHKMLAQADEMLSNGLELTPQQIMEYEAVANFCERLMERKKWKGYHKVVENAIYLDDMKDKSLTADEAKDWVANMYHYTITGEKVMGEKWDMDTTTMVLAENGIVFNGDISAVEGYIAMHMAWHDFYKSAYNANMENEAPFYVSLAIDMLQDDDGKHTAKEKYYIKHYILTHS